VDLGWAAVLSAAVTGAFGFLTVLVQRFRRENAKDHDLVMGMLKMVYKKQTNVEDKVDRVNDKLDTHIRHDHK